MRLNPDVADKVKRTNALRAEWAAEGKPNSDPWEFDYVLLCNKICGKSHYNMQMKIIVETEEEYNKWLAEQKTFKETVMVDESGEQAFNTEDGEEVALEETTSVE
jgi:cytochrome c oxidase subunit 2